MTEVRRSDVTPLLSVEVNRSGPQAVVHLIGELDLSTAPLLHEALINLLAESPAEIVLNLADLTYLDSTGLSLFVSTTKKAHASGAKVVLRNPQGSTQQLLEVTHLADYFD